MLEPFYNYIVKHLMLGYFKRVSNKPGDRYYVIMDEKAVGGTEARKLFNKALDSVSEEIVISGVYAGGRSGVTEEEYKTRVIRLPAPLAPIIVGYDISATEDYLVTMRNSIGEEGGKYEGYSSLFVLSEKPHDGSNPLSSICTTCTDLKSPNKPLSVDYVIGDIKAREKDVFARDHERLYFDVYLEEVAARIGDGSSSIYDLMPALSALEKKSIEGLFKKLGFFPDAVVFDVKNKLKDKAVTDRARNNYELYQQISDVMTREDEVDKVDLLTRILDEKIAKKIGSCKNDTWKDIDYQDIEDSITRKNSSDDLEIVDDIALKEEGLMTSLKHRLCRTRHNRKSTTFALVCDRSNVGVMHLVATFNKYVKQKYLNGDADLESAGNKVYVTASRPFSRMHTVGKNDNHHDFYVMSLPCAGDFFDGIDDNFVINKKGELVITVPSDKGALIFGKGVNEELISTGATYAYSPDRCYKLQIDASAEEDYDAGFRFDFSGTLVSFVVKVNVDAAGVVDPLTNPEKRDRFCKFEDLFYAKKATTLEVVKNALTQAETIVDRHEPLDEDVSRALAAIYSYYESRNAGPSLLPITDEVKSLFGNYLQAVIKCLSGIESGNELSPTQYALTKLGVVECGEKIYFSSFNPLMVAYTLEYERQKDITEEDYRASELLSPFYLAPFISYNNVSMRPCCDDGLKGYKNWLCYEEATSRPQDRAQDITTRMVCSKMQEFIRHFSYLFQDLDCPIIISTIGIEDDRNVIKGVLQFITKAYKAGVQKIELHEYISNLMTETFFEKLNRLVSADLIARELESLDVKIEKKGEYTSQEIIRQLFTRVVLYKHRLGESIGYCHIAFYQMDTGSKFIRYKMSKMRGELAFNGLVSIPSTLNCQGKYYIGFGCGGVDSTPSDLYRMAQLTNSLYANEENRGASAFQPDVGYVKMHEFNRTGLLNSIYDNANWVTFLNPEVDIDFFYKQDLYIVHYTDQYSINAKYDSITVTKHINQYDNMLKKSYERYDLSADKFDAFNDVMKKYFNCLNGNWLLSIINKTESQINEKMSLVATSVIMQRFMRRAGSVIWVPVSLEEILRVTGSIRLPRHYIFTKDDLGAAGAMSDDLLMMGLDVSDPDHLGMYLYPIEVKLSKNTSFADKGGEQVSNTYRQIKDHLFGEDNFAKKIFRTFFASQFLVNAEKLRSNELMSEEAYVKIEQCRYRLLNLQYTLREGLPVVEMGRAALVSFFSDASHSLRTSTIRGVNVCEIHFSEKECFEFVADPDNRAAEFLSRDPIENCISDTPYNEEDDDSEVTQSLTMPEAHVSGETPEGQHEEPAMVESSERANVPGASQLVGGADVAVAPLVTDRSMKVVLGSAKGTGREIVFEPNNTRMVSHPNMGIIGTMGTGKTQFARSLIAQLSRESQRNVDGKPVGVLVFDYKGDYKDAEFLSATGGVAYKYNFPFNPLKLIVTPDLEGVNLPAVTADRISDSFAKAYGLGLRQQGNVKQVIIDTYADFGITRDPSTWQEPAPTMENVIAKYFNTYDANDKAYVLFDKLRDYTIFTTDNNACVSIFEWLDKIRVIDLTLYPDDTKKVIVSLILDLFYAEMRQLGGSKQVDGYRQLRSFIMVDEAHQFLKKDFNSLRSIISEGRMFGVGMILSTQNLGDFRSANEDYSQFILSWVIHHVNSISKTEIASIFGATDKNAERYMDCINHAQLFESVCKIGESVNAMRDLPFFELVQRGL